MIHREAQSEFERSRDLYNNLRPHEGIAMSIPVKRYRPSERAFPDTLPAPVYGPDDEVVRVGWHGRFTFRGRALKVSRSFELMDLAARPNAEKDGRFDFYFYRHHLMALDLNQPIFHDGTCQLCPRTGVNHVPGLNNVFAHPLVRLY